MTEAASPARTQHPWFLHAVCTSEARSVLTGRVRQPSVLARRESCQHFYGEDLGRCFTLPPGTRISRGGVGQAWGKPRFPLRSSRAVNTSPPPTRTHQSTVSESSGPLICWKKPVLEAVQCLERGRGSSEGRGMPFPPPSCRKLFQSISFMRCLCPAHSAAKTEIIFHDIVCSNNWL